MWARWEGVFRSVSNFLGSVQCCWCCGSLSCHIRLESHLSAYASSSGAPGKQPFVDVDSTVRPFLKLLDLRKKNNTSAFLSRFSYFTASSPQKLEVHKHRKDR